MNWWGSNGGNKSKSNRSGGQRNEHGNGHGYPNPHGNHNYHGNQDYYGNHGYQQNQRYGVRQTQGQKQTEVQSVVEAERFEKQVVDYTECMQVLVKKGNPAYAIYTTLSLSSAHHFPFTTPQNNKLKNIGCKAHVLLRRIDYTQLLDG